MVRTRVRARVRVRIIRRVRVMVRVGASVGLGCVTLNVQWPPFLANAAAGVKTIDFLPGFGGFVKQ